MGCRPLKQRNKNKPIPHTFKYERFSSLPKVKISIKPLGPKEKVRSNNSLFLSFFFFFYFISQRGKVFHTLQLQNNVFSPIFDLVARCAKDQRRLSRSCCLSLKAYDLYVSLLMICHMFLTFTFLGKL